MFERFTERARQVVVLAQEEARSPALKHNYIGTEHLLLGLVRDNEGVAARILLDFDADSETIRNEVIRMLSGPAARRAYVDAPRWTAAAAPDLPSDAEQDAPVLGSGGDLGWRGRPIALVSATRSEPSKLKGWPSPAPSRTMTSAS